MSTEDSVTGTGMSEQPAPTPVAEQPKQPSLEERLIAQAKEEGQIVDDRPGDSATVTEPEVETPVPEEQELPLPEPPETPAEGEDAAEPEEDDQKPTAKKDDWPESAKARVAEETEKKRRANDRADRVESELQKAQSRINELENSLTQSGGPLPTETNPFADIQDPLVLDKFERVYEAEQEVDLEKINEDGTISMPVDTGRDGKFVYRDLTPEAAKLAQVRAERAVRKFIPQRRKLLDDRAKIDAQANQWFPDLQNTEHEFTKAVNQMTNNVLSGRVANDPSVRFWVANAVYGYMKRQEEAKANGNGKSSDSEVNKIVQGSKVKVAPTAPRSRSLGQKQTSGADLAKAVKRLEENPDDEATQLAYLAAARSVKGQNQTVPVAE